MLTMMARLSVRPDKAAEMAALLTALAAESRKEAGCIRYTVYQHALKPTEFTTLEEWRDQAAVDFHMQTPYIAAAFAKAPELVTAAPDISPWTPLG